MTLATAEIPMAKKKMGRPLKGRNDVTARVDADVIRKAKKVASLLDVSLNEYLSIVLAPIVDRDLKKAAGKIIDKDPN